ncbi:hypothetical protein NQ176_g493 [Zarea fungicola]|uniref:Uncharacterized protein n=1 Tax=Zarea fungicola TaxID=93591 RepID=A0ACC1NZH4_9HYPO|nr:hypothetical protein NQ176_g493 [Lecanicillium fungicola]
MPMHMRKGIVASASAKEAKRRREAKENGVILERSAQGKKKSSARGGRNERGVDGPGIGRFKGAELRINAGEEGEQDVDEFEQELHSAKIETAFGIGVQDFSFYIYIYIYSGF